MITRTTIQPEASARVTSRFLCSLSSKWRSSVFSYVL